MAFPHRAAGSSNGAKLYHPADSGPHTDGETHHDHLTRTRPQPATRRRAPRRPRHHADAHGPRRHRGGPRGRRRAPRFHACPGDARQRDDGGTHGARPGRRARRDGPHLPPRRAPDQRAGVLLDPRRRDGPRQRRDERPVLRGHRRQAQRPRRLGRVPARAGVPVPRTDRGLLRGPYVVRRRGR